MSVGIPLLCALDSLSLCVVTKNCRGYRIRVNGQLTHSCDRCSTSISDSNFGLLYQGSKETWRDGVLASAERARREAVRAGLDPVPVDRGRWV